MKLVNDITVSELNKVAKRLYGELVKAVVDVEKKLLVIDAELHSDEEQLLLEQGSKQTDLWGINLHPKKFGTKDFIEYDSMINIKPRQKNMTRGVEDKMIRNKIVEIVAGIVKK